MLVYQLYRFFTFLKSFLLQVPPTGHGMMDHEEDGEVAINLSTNQAPRSADTPNGNAEPEDGEPQVSDFSFNLTFIE